MTARIVLFLGVSSKTKEARYARWDRLDDASAEETRLPWSVLVAEAQSEPDNAEPIQVVGICSDTTQYGWEDHLADDICRAGFTDRAELPIGFLTYDEDRLDPSNYWSLFEKLRVALSGEALDGSVDLRLCRGSKLDVFGRSAERVVVDITHGFRAIPFIGASALSFVQGANRRHQREVAYRICYAAEQAERNGVIPVWDLTPFAEGVKLGDALDAFARHGRADDLSAFFGQSKVPAGQRLAEPMRKFADDLLLMRIPDLLTQSTPSLQSMLASSLNELKDKFPSLREDLDKFKAQIDDLAPGGQPQQPVNKSGLRAAAVLAQRLWDTGRYAELYNLLRESTLTAFSVLFFDNDQLQQPRATEFDKQRGQIERRWKDWSKSSKPASGGVKEIDGLPLRTQIDEEHASTIRKQSAEITDVRNDVAHCSMRSEPRSQSELKEELKKRISDFQNWVASL